jgi:DNA-binding response OmpR family regulator
MERALQAVSASENGVGMSRSSEFEPAERRHSESLVPAPRPGARVLVIDDERFARGALRLILEQDGYEVRVTGSGRAAVKLLRAFNPQIVIMDWVLPGLSGESLYREIRRVRAEVPIILISSSDEAFSSSVDASARLRKPIDVRRLRTVVTEKSQARTASSPEPSTANSGRPRASGLK